MLRLGGTAGAASSERVLGEGTRRGDAQEEMAYAPGGGKTIALPGTWLSNTASPGRMDRQSFAQASAGWSERAAKEATAASAREPDGIFSEQMDGRPIPQYQHGTNVRDSWGWGRHALVRDGHILSPIASHHTSTHQGKRFVVERPQTRQEHGDDRAFARSVLSAADLRPTTAEHWLTAQSSPPQKLVARSWDTGHSQSWDNSLAAMSMHSMSDLPSVRKAKMQRSTGRSGGSRRSPSPVFSSPSMSSSSSRSSNSLTELAELRHELDEVKRELAELRGPGGGRQSRQQRADTCLNVRTQFSKQGKRVPSENSGLLRVHGSVWERSATDRGRIASRTQREQGPRRAVVEAERNARQVQLDRTVQQVRACHGCEWCTGFRTTRSHVLVAVPLKLAADILMIGGGYRPGPQIPGQAPRQSPRTGSLENYLAHVKAYCIPSEVSC